jgi:hypothetical protein
MIGTKIIRLSDRAWELTVTTVPPSRYIMDTSHVASVSPKFQTLRQCKRKVGGNGLEGGHQHSRLVVKTANTKMIDSMASGWSLFKPMDQRQYSCQRSCRASQLQQVTISCQHEP